MVFAADEPGHRISGNQTPMPDKVLSIEERRNKYAVPAVEKALDIIEYLSEQAVPMTQAQLGRALGRQPGELFRMLTALEARGYLRRDALTGGYTLTLKLFELSRTHSPYEELLRAAVPVMRGLADEVRETCHLSVIHRDKILVLAQEESPKPVRLSVEVGSLHSPLSTTSGRLLLGAMDKSARDAFLRGATNFFSRAEEEQTAFLNRVVNVQARGYEIAEGERFVGGLDLGVLVGAPGSTIKAALVIATLKYADGPDLETMLPPLHKAAETITAQAGLGLQERGS
jgi:DNA-binding IclR family transcriptional regulator